MSYAGNFPRKQSNRAARRHPKPAPDYQRLMRPLPTPPAGLSWMHNPSSAQKWTLLADAEAQAMPVHEEDATLAPTAAAAAATITEHPNNHHPVVATVVPLEMDQSSVVPSADKRKEPPQPVLAQAEIASVDTTIPLNGDENVPGDDNDDDEQEGIAMLPQANMVQLDGAAPCLPLAMARGKYNDDDDDDDSSKKDQLGVDYTEHVVLPTDTLAGICLLYKISRRELQRANRFYGDNLRLAPGKLYIPITEKARRLGWKIQDTDSREFKMAAFMAQFRSLSMMEAKCYLETNDWDLEEALQEAHQDAEWEKQEAERVRMWQEQQDQARQEAEQERARCNPNRKNDPYADDPRDQEDDDNCLSCFSFLVSFARLISGI